MVFCHSTNAGQVLRTLRGDENTQTLLVVIKFFAVFAFTGDVDSKISLSHPLCHLARLRPGASF